MDDISGKLQVIGFIQSPYKTLAQAPFQGNDQISKIELKNEFVDGLMDIDGFSHLHVFYWLHKSYDYNLIVKTPWDIKKHGLFTTRSPHRPNPIGYAVVELVDRNENILIVKGLDAIDGTPVIDIKPYIEKCDCKTKSFSGWLENIDLD